MEPIEYFRIVRRRWPMLVVITLLGLAAGYVTARPASSAPVTTTTAPFYQATATLVIPSSTTDPSGLSLDTMAFLATSPPVLAATAKSLGDKARAADLRAVQVSPRDALNLLNIYATEPSAAYAATVANALGGTLITFINGQQLHAYELSVKSAKHQLTTWSSLISQYQSQPSSPLVQVELGQARTEEDQQAISYLQLRAAGASYTDLHVIEPATAPSAVLVGGGGPTAAVAIKSNRKSRLALGGLAGLLVGLGLALVWERLDSRIRTREQAETVLGVPVLGEVPSVSPSRRHRGLVMVDDPASASAEAYRMVQTALAASSPGDLRAPQPQAVLLSSPGRLAGKELVVANLAASFSEAGSSVVIVAADSFDLSLPALMRRSRGANPPRDEKTTRLRASADDNGPVAEASATVIDGVSLLMNGNRPVLGNGQARPHADLVSAGRRIADVVLIDTPPVLLTHDAGRLSPDVDSVVLMCEIGGVTAEEGRLAVERLRRIGAPLKGVVLVGSGRPMGKLRGVLRVGGGQHARKGAASGVARGEAKRNEAEGSGAEVSPHSPSTSVP